MKILDRYLFRELFGPFIFGIAAFSSILAGSTVLFNLVGAAVRFGFGLMPVIQIFMYKLPGVIVFTFPMSMLLATILVIGRLNSDQEIIALRAGGVSLYRIIAPIILVGFFVSLLTIWFSESVVPSANSSAETLYQSLQHQGPKLKQNINVTEYDGDHQPLRIINALEVNGDSLKTVTVAEYEQGRLARIIRADSGQYIPSGGWHFFHGVMHSFPKDQYTQVFVMEFEKEAIDLLLNPKELTQREKNSDELSAAALARQIAMKKRTGKDVVEDVVKWHMKLSVPFASLIFAILGASVGLRPVRSSSSIGLGVSLLIIIIYYILMTISTGLGLSGGLPPVVAAWAPNVIIGAAGFFILRRAAS